MVRKYFYRTGICLMLMSAVFMMSTCMMAGEGNMNKESGAYPFENRTVVPGEYVVTADKGGNVAFLREYFAEYTVLEIDQFGENLYRVKLKTDPGLEELKKKGAKTDRIKDIQPNFIYRSIPKKRLR